MKKLIILSAVAALAVTPELMAQQLKAKSNNPSWSGVTGTPGSSGITQGSSNAGKTISLEWGQTSPYSLDNRHSKYTYAARTGEWNVAPSNHFLLGTFTHVNYPVTGNVLDKVTLNVSFTFTDYLLNTVTVNKAISIDHNETNNPAGDVVTFLNYGGVETFTLGNYEYQFSIAGLYKNSNGTNLMNSFTTKESKCTKSIIGICKAWDEKKTTGYLYGSLSYSEIPPPVVTTPEPSTYVLMAAGLAGLGFAARRRRSA